MHTLDKVVSEEHLLSTNYVASYRVSHAFQAAQTRGLFIKYNPNTFSRDTYTKNHQLSVSYLPQ